MSLGPRLPRHPWQVPVHFGRGRGKRSNPIGWRLRYGGADGLDGSLHTTSRSPLGEAIPSTHVIVHDRGSQAPVSLPFAQSA